MLPSIASIRKQSFEPSPDPYQVKRNSFTHYRCEVIFQLMRNDSIYAKIKGLIDAGATATLVAGHLFTKEELQSNLLPVTFIQQKSMFTTNKFAMS